MYIQFLHFLILYNQYFVQNDLLQQYYSLLNVQQERRTGSFSRSFTLDGIQEDAIRASYQDGVLELILPKRQEVLPQCHKIQIQ